MQEKIKQFVGKKGIIRLGSLTIKVTVKDYKQSYGKERWLVSPIAGAGDTWTEQNPIPAK